MPVLCRWLSRLPPPGHTEYHSTVPCIDTEIGATEGKRHHGFFLRQRAELKREDCCMCIAGERLVENSCYLASRNENPTHKSKLSGVIKNMRRRSNRAEYGCRVI